MNSKVLVVSHNCFSKVSNNGKTLESIFSSFPKNDIGQVFFTEDSNIDFDFCDNYYRITDSNVIDSLFKGKSSCGQALSAFEKGFDLTTQKQKSLLKFAKSKKYNAAVFRDLLWSFGSWKSNSFIKWCKKFNPDIIFYVGGNYGFSHNISCFLSKYFDIPLVSYFTDDYLIYPKNKNFFEYLQKIRMKFFYERTIKNSSLCFAIGDIMADEYSKYFGKKFHPIMNSIDMRILHPYVEREEIILSYFGGLHLDRWKMILRLANSLTNGVINVYSIEKPSEEILLEFKKFNINFKGAVKGEDLDREILKSDILLHVEADDEYNRALTKLSISTKIPEYLMFGRMVLGFGPLELASMRVLSDNNIGKVISSSITDNCLKSELNKITSNFKLRQKIAVNGYKYAVQNFDNKIISKKFKKNIETLTSNHEN